MASKPSSLVIPAVFAVRFGATILDFEFEKAAGGSAPGVGIPASAVAAAWPAMWLWRPKP